MKSWSGKRHHTWAHTWFEQRASSYSWLTDLKYKSLDLKSIRCAFLVAESTCPNWCIGSESGYLVIILWSFFSNLAWLRVSESLQTQCRQSRWCRSLSLPVARKLDRDTQQRKASVKPMTGCSESKVHGCIPRVQARQECCQQQGVAACFSCAFLGFQTNSTSPRYFLRWKQPMDSDALAKVMRRALIQQLISLSGSTHLNEEYNWSVPRMKLAPEKWRSKQRNEGRKDRRKERKQARKGGKKASKEGRNEGSKNTKKRERRRRRRRRRT